MEWNRVFVSRSMEGHVFDQLQWLTTFVNHFRHLVDVTPVWKMSIAITGCTCIEYCFPFGLFRGVCWFSNASWLPNIRKVSQPAVFSPSPEKLCLLICWLACLWINVLKFVNFSELFTVKFGERMKFVHSVFSWHVQCNLTARSIPTVKHLINNQYSGTPN